MWWQLFNSYFASGCMQMQLSQPVPAWHQSIFAQMNVCIGAFYNYQGSKYHLLNTASRYSKGTIRVLYYYTCCNYSFMHCVLLHICIDAEMHWCLYVLMHQCTNALMHWCTNALMHWCTDALMQRCTDAWMQRCTDALTLRPLSVFFKILQISDTGLQISWPQCMGTVSFLYLKLSLFFNREYYF